MPVALADLLRRLPLNGDKVAFAWREAVGQSMSRGTTVSLEGRVLRVRPGSAAWGCEVVRSEALIRARLDTLLGRGVVTAIEVCGGPEKAG